uniref:Uncharacterized protein n=1 Tax=Plectus sambesii TaxID=2011161 RepID=A0A914XG82_9BILA
MHYNAHFHRNENATRRLPIPVDIPTVPRRPVVQQSDFLFDLHQNSYLPSCWTNPVTEKSSVTTSRYSVIDKSGTTTPKSKSMPKSWSSVSEDEQVTVASILKKFSKLETFDKASLGSSKRQQAKEKLTLALASLPEEERVLLSNDKLDFIELCSFDGRDCTIEKDFKLTIDPIYGNCYTFNADTSTNISSTKHGSAYGLIMQLNMHTGDFIRTSEATGFRVSIHGKSHHPFPDSNGYSAPVGFLTTFGIKKRLTHTFSTLRSNCTKKGKNQKYIYPEYDYQMEGCQRSCIQRALIEICSCADPRLPTPANTKRCATQNDAFLRECLKTTMFKMGDANLNPRILNGCEQECRLPCDQENFDVAISMAQWPASPANIDNCYDPNPDECFKHYK